MTPLGQALSLWRRGLSVVPVPRPEPCPRCLSTMCEDESHWPDGRRRNGKVPAIAWRAYQSRRPTEAEIRRWFGGAPMNLAIITGAASDIVVVDIDSPEARRFAWRRMPYTPWQTTTSKGWHLFYRWPGMRVPNRARSVTDDGRLALDVRGDGGFVIAPGSVHATGVIYQEAGDWNVPKDQLPRFWPGWLERPTRPTSPRPRGPRPTGNVVERARRYLATARPPEIGGGSDAATFCKACRLVLGFGLSETDATELLWEWAGNRPGWTRDWIAAKVAHARKYGTEPVGGLVS